MYLYVINVLFYQEIVANVSSPVPRFTAVGLIPGTTYAAAVLAYNAKGRGDPYPLRASTLRPPEKHHVHDKSLGEYRYFNLFVQLTILPHSSL